MNLSSFKNTMIGQSQGTKVPLQTINRRTRRDKRVCKDFVMSLDKLDESFTDILTKHRLLIVQNLQVNRTFLFDYLISKKTFDKTDYELIQAEKTSESKAGRFLDILAMKGESAFCHFLDVLQVVNPNLYEMMTGESATKRVNPIFSEIKSQITFGGGSSFLDVEILSNFVKRQSEELQDLAFRLDQVLKENNELRRRLDDSLSEQGRKQKKIEALEKQVSDTQEALASEARSSASKDGENLLQRFEVIQREGRTNQFIIQLQMRLLTAHEENETLRKQLEDARASNTFKKRETTKLSQQLKSQSAELKSYEGLKQKLREVQFENGKLRCELQEKEDEVLELTKVKHWTEALTARYDLIVAEKEKALKNQEVIERKCTSQQDDISDLMMKLNLKEKDIEELQRSNKEAEDNSRIYREARDFYCKAITETALELEEVRKEKEDAAHRYNKMLESKESSICQQAEYLRQFEKKYEETKEELRAVKLSLAQERKDNEELRKRISNLELELKQKEPISQPYLEDKDDEDESPTQDSCDESEKGETDHDVGSFIDWKNIKERQNKDIVGSIIRRIEEPYQQTKVTQEKAISKSISLDERLASILPEFDSLPPDTKKGLSIDRNRMKQSLSYELLATMVPRVTAVGASSFPEALSAAISRSHDSNYEIGQSRNHFPGRRIGFRKMSDPVGVEYFSLQLQNPNVPERDQEKKEAEGDLAGDEIETFEDKKEEGQHGFRSRTQAIRLRTGERRRRRTEPALFTQGNEYLPSP